MTGNWSFSYDFSTPQPAPKPAPKPAAPRQSQVWAFEDAGAIPADQNQVVLLNRRDGGKALLTGGVYQALSLCQRFDTHENHVRRILKAFPALPRPDLEKAIGAVRQAGFIVDEAMVWERLRGEESDAPATPLELIAIATCDRPAPLKRLLASLGENERAGGIRRRYLIVDDSRGSDNIRQNQSLLAEAREAFGLDLRYHGQAELQELLEVIAKAAPESLPAARFLLIGPEGWSGPTHGRSWNRALLLGAGAPLAKVDDDVLARVCLGPGGGARRIDLSCGARAARFFDGPDDWQLLLDQERRDPLAEMDPYIGQRLGNALARMARSYGAERRLDHVHSYQVRDLTAQSKVVISACGYARDPGTSSNNWLYALREESRADFTRSEAFYRRAKRERNLWMGRFAPAFSPTYSLISGIAGLDNRELIPPMFPVMRNEDFLFGAMMQYLFPQSVMIDHDFVIPHLPEPPRVWEQDSADSAENMGAVQFLGSWLHRKQVGLFAPSFESRWRTMQGDLSDLAGTAHHRLRLLAEEGLMLFHSNAARNRQEELAEAGNAPQYWRADLERSIRNNLQALKSQERRFFHDIPGNGDIDSRARQFGELVQGFSEGFSRWPLLREIVKFRGAEF